MEEWKLGFEVFFRLASFLAIGCIVAFIITMESIRNK